MVPSRFGGVLLRILDAHGITRAEFARQISHPRSYVTYLVDGRNRPPPEVVPYWCALLGFSDQEQAALLDAAYLAHTPEPIVLELLQLRAKSRHR
jgi:hypothetical protein